MGREGRPAHREEGRAPAGRIGGWWGREGGGGLVRGKQRGRLPEGGWGGAMGGRRRRHLRLARTPPAPHPPRAIRPHASPRRARYARRGPTRPSARVRQPPRPPVRKRAALRGKEGPPPPPRPLAGGLRGGPPGEGAGARPGVSAAFRPQIDAQAMYRVGGLASGNSPSNHGARSWVRAPV